MPSAEQDLLENLLIEMTQTERSAKEHPRKEAERLETGAPPARALLSVSSHAGRILPELERLAGPQRANIGETIGSLFSVVRDALLDKLISREKSYRGTLIGLHHGIDCAMLTRAVATTCARPEIVTFLDAWLAEREPLVVDCQRELGWFASRAELASERAA